MEINNLERLSCFIEVARYRSFSRAADALHITQPAVSRHIKELESLVGAGLFDRLGRGVAVTEAGLAFLTLAERVWAAAQDLEAQIAGMSGKLSGVLRIGSSTVWEYLLPGFMGTFMREHPESTLSLVVGNTGQIIEMMRKSDIHLGFIGEAPKERDLDVTFMAEDELVIVTPPGHPLAHKRVAPAELAGHPFVLREADSATARIALRYLESLGVQPKKAMELGSHEALKAGVRAGFGLGVISRLAIGEELAANTLARLELDAAPCKRPLFVLRNPARAYSVLQKAFLAHVVRGL